MSSGVRVSSVSKAYRAGGRELRILRDVSFSVEPGRMVAVTGPSGIGKTTLLHLLGTLDRPDSGQIHYGRTAQSDMRGATLAAFRNRHIGFVFQFFQLLPEFNAVEKVMMPLLISGCAPREAERRARQILAEVGLGERLSHYPNQLSGGEQQRAAIARALVVEPELLLADEPTGNLDVGTGARVFTLLRQLQQKRSLTSIIVTHNIEIASRCDSVLSLGELMADG